MRRPVLKTINLVLAAGAGLLSIPALILGCYLLSCWVRIHTTDVFYVEYPYLLAACVLIGMGIFGACCSLYGARRRSYYGLILLVPILLGFATLVYIPDGTPHVQRSMMDDANYLSVTGSFLRVWYESHRRFPKDQAEFLDALRNGPAAWQDRVKTPPIESDYARRGVRLPYQVVVINNASEPRLANLSQQPGIVYYCVTDDEQQFWVTMTGLREDVSRAATLRRIADSVDDKPWVVTAAGKDYPLPIH